MEIIIAFDKDIGEEYIQNVIRPFKKYRKCSYIYDEMGLLDEKDSPTDKGKTEWNMLLSSRK